MNPSYHLSYFEKGQIETFKELEWSNRLISQRLMRHHYTIDNYFKNKNNQHEKRKPDPKAKLNPREKFRIFREINRERTIISKIKSAVELNVSRETIRRVIQSSPNVIRRNFPENRH